MKDFIDDCIFTESMAIKWQFMLADARVTLTKAFDVMIRSPDMIAGYSSKLVKISSITFNVQHISIGYAEFVIASNPRTVNVLIDAFLKDGDAIVEWGTLPKEAQFIFSQGLSL